MISSANIGIDLLSSLAGSDIYTQNISTLSYGISVLYSPMLEISLSTFT